MTTMLLWLNTGDLAGDVEKARIRFREKNKQEPDTLWLRPGVAKELEIEGLEIVRSKTITPMHLGLSREG